MHIRKLYMLIFLFAGVSMAADRYIDIATPTTHEIVVPGQSLLVSGTGRGMYEGNVVVRIEDTDGEMLLQVPTTMTRSDIAAEGQWQISITLPKPLPDTLILSAFSPSPREGDAAISSPSITLATGEISALQGPDWKLRRYRDASGAMIQVLDDTRVTVRFRDGKLSGSGGCNRYFGSYTIEQHDQLVFSASISVTMMACAPPVSEQERQYLNDLSTVTGFQLDDESLRLLDKDRKVVLEYTLIKPLALEGTLWRAVGINNGRGGVESMATTQLATARFEDGKVSGHAGCNTFTASYEITDDQISMGPAMTTRMHCAEPDGIMDQEQQYLAALSRAQVFELTDNGLKLRDENGSLQVNYVAGDTAQ